MTFLLLYRCHYWCRYQRGDWIKYI